MLLWPTISSSSPPLFPATLVVPLPVIAAYLFGQEDEVCTRAGRFKFARMELDAGIFKFARITRCGFAFPPSPPALAVALPVLPALFPRSCIIVDLLITPTSTSDPASGLGSQMRSCYAAASRMQREHQSYHPCKAGSLKKSQIESWMSLM